MFFDNRLHAGQRLTKTILDSGRDFSDYQVVGIARGGVIVAQPIAQALGSHVHAICVDDFKVGGNKMATVTSLGHGAIHSMGEMLMVSDFRCIDYPGFSEFRQALDDRHVLYNGGSDFVPGEKVLLVDDGIVSGESAIIAAYSLRQQGVSEVVLAVPVILPWVAKANLGFEVLAWRISTLKNAATGMFYFEFNDVPDEQVVKVVAA